METDKEGSSVRMAGRLTGEYLEEAERVCHSAEHPLLIDARELQGADASGLEFLVRVLDGGARLEGLSQYLAMRIRLLRERQGS